MARDKAKQAAWAKANREKRNAQQRLRRAQNPGRALAWHRKAKMSGLPDVAAEPGDPCACCLRPMRRVYADHCHTKGRFRGFVCHRCNLWLAARDAKDWMQAADDYLKRTTGQD